MFLAKSFKELYIDPEDRSEQWDNKVFELGFLGKVEELDEHINSADELYFEERQIYTAINKFTLKTVSEKEKNRLFNLLREEEFIKEINIIDSNVLIETKDTKIIASKLSGMIPTLEKEDKDIETENRKGNCHKRSIMISKSLGVPNEVVTGYIFGCSDKAKYLHSWVEFNFKGRDVVIDYNLNILMNKDGYYYMQHAIPISRISDKNIKEDNEIIQKFGKIGHFNLKEYLVFRDEIMKDFEKNKRIFEEER